MTGQYFLAGTNFTGNNNLTYLINYIKKRFCCLLRAAMQAGAFSRIRGHFQMTQAIFYIKRPANPINK